MPPPLPILGQTIDRCILGADVGAYVFPYGGQISFINSFAVIQLTIGLIDFLIPNSLSDNLRQPRPQGFSLKKWVGREKPWGRG